MTKERLSVVYIPFFKAVLAVNFAFFSYPKLTYMENKQYKRGF